MSTTLSIKIPLLNPNELEAMLVTLHVSEGQHVEAGNPICTLETTKSTVDLKAEVSGYIFGLRYTEGQIVLTGEHLCYLADSPDWTPPETESLSPEKEPKMSVPEGLRITQPALNLAEKLNLELAKLPIGPLITEKNIQSFIHNEFEQGIIQSTSAFDVSAIIIYGDGGHGKSLIDLLRASGTYNIVGIVDDGLDANDTIMGLPVLGGGEVLAGLYKQGIHMAVNAVGGIGNLNIRLEVFHRLAKAGFVCPPVVHPRAFIEPSASLSPGVQVFPHAYVGSEAHLGFGTIVNTGAIISHECVLGDFVNISPGAILAGMVQVDAGTLVGMGATINLDVKIGTRARIGNGATVKVDVPDDTFVRAGTIWPE